MTLRSLLGCLICLSCTLGGCRDEPPGAIPSSGVGGASAPATEGASGSAGGGPLWEEAIRQAREVAQKALNPKGLPPYSGPVGAIRGTVTVTGDPPPFVPAMVAKLPEGACPRAHELHRKLYRQGADRTLADVLVTVTEYQGYLPPRGDAVRVEMKGCAFDGRILAMTFGQHFDVFNLDAQAYMPRLVGTATYALRVAMPGGAPVPIFAPQPGQYMLVDQTREYMRADVFVLNYPTFDVTGLDGRFDIGGIPVGDVKVTVYAAALGKVVEQRVTLQAGVDQDLAFEVAFSQSEHDARLKSSPEAAAP